MTFEEYLKYPALSSTGLKAFSDLPAKYEYAMANKGYSPSPAFLLGTSVHARVLEDKYDYVVLDESQRPVPEKDFRTKANSSWKKSIVAEAEANGKRVVTKIQSDLIDAMVENCKKEQVYKKYIAQGHCEKQFFGTCSITGLKLKSQIDCYTDKGTLIDLKTTKCAQPFHFTRDLKKYNYPLQLAFYAYVLKLNGIDIERAKILAVESIQPAPTLVVNVIDIKAYEPMLIELLQKFREYKDGETGQHRILTSYGSANHLIQK